MKVNLKPYSLLLLVLIIGYFPVVSFITSVKNDILTGYLPVRFFMSESISSGYTPWWNPYVNFGLPQYADMSSGFWSPITWLIASTAGYNVYTITIELLLYILLGAWGIYKCGEIFGWSKEVKLIAAISYMCCGYMIGHLQHLNWISGAGFLPWCFWAYHIILTKFSWKTLLQAVLLFNLLITSSHPGIIIGCIYFFAGYTVYQYLIRMKINTSEFSTWVYSKTILLFLSILLLVSVALIISYTEILPFITRGDKIAIGNHALNATTTQSWISLFFPLATVKNDTFFSNDIALRNCYIGITLLAFLILSFNLKRKETLFFLLTGLFFFILSDNNFIQSFCYEYFPLLGYVRLNGEFRIFALFCFIITAASNLHYYLNVKADLKKLKKVFLFLSAVSAGVIIWSCIKLSLTKESILFSPVRSGNLLSISFLKSVTDQLSFYDVLILQGTIQFLFLTQLKRAIQLKIPGYLLLLVIADLCTATLLQMPFTGVGTKSTREIQSLLDASPKGIPVPLLQPLSNNDTGKAGIKNILGSWSFYNKQPGTVTHAAYPIQFKIETDFFKPQIQGYIKTKPFVFFAEELINKESLIRQAFTKKDTSKQKIEILTFSPNQITVKLKTTNPGYLVLLYKYYPHWTANINGIAVKADNYLYGFMKININNPGEQRVEFNFSPTTVKWAMALSAISFLFVLATLITLSVRKKSEIDPAF